MSTTTAFPLGHRQRGAASRRIIGLIGLAAVAAILLSALYVTGAQGTAQSLDRLPPTGATTRDREVRPAPIAEDASATAVPTATFHAGVSFDGIDAEPDPSPRAVAAYER